MAKPYSQDLRDRVIDAVERGEMSRRAAARHYEVSVSVAIKWLERLERHGSREPVGHGGHRASKPMPHQDFLEAARTEKSDVTLQALCNRLLAERGVKADTSKMSRFFRKISMTFKTYGPPRLQGVLSRVAVERRGGDRKCQAPSDVDDVRRGQELTSSFVPYATWFDPCRALFQGHCEGRRWGQQRGDIYPERPDRLSPEPRARPVRVG